MKYVPSAHRMKIKHYFLINSLYNISEYEARAKVLLTDMRRVWIQLFSNALYELLEPEL